MTNNSAYTETGLVQIVGYRNLYPDVATPPKLEELLKSISREHIIRIVQLFVNSFNNAGIETMQKFFSTESVLLKEEFNNRFNAYKKGNRNYQFFTIQTSIELLRYAFSIKPEPSDLTPLELESNILQAVLIINDQLQSFKSKLNGKDEYIKTAQFLLANNFSQMGVDFEDINQIFRESFIKSIDFFDYVVENEILKKTYKIFLSEKGINDYNEYITTVFGVFAIIYKNAISSTSNQTDIKLLLGNFAFEPNKIQDNLISKKTLDELSINWDEIIELDKNHDYSYFKGKPLIKKDNGDYAITNLRFLLERLFNSLYFDFKKIAKDELKMKEEKFNNEYKKRFFEETLLRKYINRVNSNNRYFYLSGSEAKAIKEEKAPDSYLKNLRTDYVILIEHKDIKIEGEVKQSRDLELIISDFKNKLLLTKVSNGKKLEKPRLKGIGQLVNSIEMIRNQTFVWDKDVIKGTKIYPVLVLTDSNIIPDGLPYLMNEWLYENLKEKNINFNNIRPLIVMEISTLLLYADEFRENGLEYYFEKYYDSIETAKKYFISDPLLSTTNMNISFSIYMQKAFQKNHEEVFNEYIKKVI